jgi:hypothetical protein
LVTKGIVVSTEHELPFEDVYEILRISMPVGEDSLGLQSKFEFPISIGRDLTNLLVLRTFVHVDLVPGEREGDGPRPQLASISIQHL